MDVSPLAKLCQKEIEAKGFPGAAFAVGTAGSTAHKTVGRFTYDANSPSIREDSLFDIASLTKVVATTPAAMLLFDDGLLDLDKSVRHYLPEFKGESKEKVVVRNLLLHDSGLPAYATLTTHKTKEDARKAVLALPLKAKPGEQTEYS